MIGRVLIIEDDILWQQLLTKHLEEAGYSVESVSNLNDGFSKIKDEIYHFITVDLQLDDKTISAPNFEGIKILENITRYRIYQHTGIMVISGYDKDYKMIIRKKRLSKNFLIMPKSHFDKNTFLEIVNRYINSNKLHLYSLSTPYKVRENENSLSLSCSAKQKIGIRVDGVSNFKGFSDNDLLISYEVYARQGRITYNHNWRFNTKDTGGRLFKEIFVDHTEVISAYKSTIGSAKKKDKIHIRFEHTREMVRVPLEFLYDHTNSGGDYLVLNHPFSRSIIGIHVRLKNISPQFLNGLVEKKERLKVLLIASDTGGIPEVEQEILLVREKIEKLFKEKGLTVEIDYFMTKDATHRQIYDHLLNCNYHIVHYAGHGHFDDDSSEKSCLYFWEKPNKEGEILPMTGSELQVLVKNSNIHFFYLSCCVGTNTASNNQLLDDDFLGIADSLILAGIPSVLGFRWPVSDFGARQLALAFYSSLAENGQLSQALLQARCEIAAANRDDITWLSPVLIMQS